MLENLCKVYIQMHNLIIMRPRSYIMKKDSRTWLDTSQHTFCLWPRSIQIFQDFSRQQSPEWSTSREFSNGGALHPESMNKGVQLLRDRHLANDIVISTLICPVGQHNSGLILISPCKGRGWGILHGPASKFSTRWPPSLSLHPGLA